MDIPINADIWCSDGVCGHTTSIIVDPITQKITHIVVKEKHSPHIERLVPESFIVEASPDSIRLRCSETELSTLDEFVGIRFAHTDLQPYFPLGDNILFWPYSVADEITLAAKEERIPPGELAIHRGARVVASDGHVGRVDEFLVDPTDGRITHLILREGHLWGQKDVTIPVSEIENISDETVFIKLSKQAIAELPAIPVRRIWR